MRWIKQRNEIDCGICTVAMVAGVSWKKACDAGNHHDRDIGLHVREFVSTLAKLGVSVRQSVVGKRMPLDSASRPDNAVAAIIRPLGRARGHYVAIDRHFVIDPETGRHAIDQYHLNDWLIVRWFVLK